MVTFTVKLTSKDMMDYNMYHNYRNVSGIASLILGIIMLVLFVVSGSDSDVNISYRLLMVFFGLFFTVFTPVRIALKSAQQVKLTPSFTKPLKYTVSKESIIIEQDDMKAEFPMSEVYKVSDTGKSIVVYVNKVRAYIFPKRDIGDSYNELIRIIREAIPAKKVKVK